MGFGKSEARLKLEARVDEVVSAYARGLSVRQVADLHGDVGASRQMVKDVLAGAGVKLRGGPGRRPVRRVTAERVRIAGPVEDGHLVDLAAVRDIAGLTQPELGSVLGVTAARIAQIEGRDLGDLRLGRLSELVDGCGARLLVLVEFGDGLTVALHDSTAGDVV